MRPCIMGCEDIRGHDTLRLSFSELQLHCCDFLGQAVHLHISQLQRDCSREMRNLPCPCQVPRAVTCFLSERSICILFAASWLAWVIPQTTSLQRTSGCILHKLNLGLHLHRDTQSEFNPWDALQVAVLLLFLFLFMKPMNMCCQFDHVYKYPYGVVSCLHTTCRM